MRDGKAANVRRLAAFKDIRAADTEWVCRVADVVDVHAGTTLALKGETVREVAFVMQGIASSGEVLLGPGACYGAAELDAGRLSAMTIEARTPVRLLVFGVREFRSLLNRIPSLRTRLIPVVPQPLSEDLRLRAVS